MGTFDNQDDGGNENIKENTLFISSRLMPTYFHFLM